MPENAPPGQLPRSVKVVLENDLIDRCKPGDRVAISGVFRVIHKGITGQLESVLVATGVESLNAEKEKPSMSEADIKAIRKLAKDNDVFNILGESIAPSIEGHLNAKKAILMQLLGGAEKTLDNGTHLRGDINIMMVGDPSTAKSQLLRHVMDIAPLALNTTGRGSSGVGLTAAVTIDKDTNERHLEAGAMVLADKGTICIDEFDKMNDADRVAIHEVMEQQTVTIAKAGIHCTLNARCSVIAAANPIYSEYARDQSVGRNIGLPDSLLSRFDLLFIMLDEKDPEHDRMIAERVITNHRCQVQGTDSLPAFNFEQNNHVIEPKSAMPSSMQNEKGSIFEKNLQKTTDNVTRQVVTREFLKKFLSYVKSLKAPSIDGSCTDYAATLYAALRQRAALYDQKKVSCPVTVRTLETMIRLATAHAKLRMKKEVSTGDLDIAFRLVYLSIFGKEMSDEETDSSQKKTSKSSAARESAPAGSQAASRKKVRFNKDEESEEQDEVEYKGAQAVSSSGRNIGTRRQAAMAANRDTGMKKLRVSDVMEEDDEQDDANALNNLLNAKPVVAGPTFDMQAKKFAFKIISEVKEELGGSSKINFDLVWQRYFGMDEGK